MSANDPPDAYPVPTGQLTGRQSEKRMRLAAEAAQLGIYEWDIPNDKAIWENERMYEIFGLSHDDAPLTNAEFMKDYLHPEDGECFRESMSRAISEGTAFDLRCRIKPRNTKEFRWVQFSGEIETSAEGEPLRLTGILQDITDRRRTEKDRERFLEVGSDLQVVARHDGRFQWVSPAFEDLLGWSPEEMTSRPWSHFLHPDDMKPSEQEIEELFAGKQTFEFENRYRHKEGHYLWLQWNARTYPEESVIYGVATDITDRKIAEQDQQLLMEITEVLAHVSEPQEMMDTVGRKLLDHFRASRCVFVEYDLAGGTAELVHDACAEGIQSMKGVYQLNSLADQRILEILHQGGQLAINDLRTDPLTAERHEVFEAMGILAGLTSPYVSDGRCKYGITLHHSVPHEWAPRETRLLKDVSNNTWSAIERARIAQNLRHSRDRLRILTDALPVLISYLDKDHIYRFVNRNYTEWFGVERDGIIGRHLKEIVGEKVYQASLPKIERVLGGEAFKFEQLHPYKHGGTRYVEVSYVPDVADDGQVNGWYALVQDITDRKATEDALKEADRRKDEFLATLAHELRNPLAPLKSALDILEFEVSEDEARQARGIMVRQVDRMTHLINDLMDISRITRNKINLQKKVIDLAGVAQEAVESTGPLIDAQDQQLSLHIKHMPILVHADHNRMVQVITNLLSNASKFSDPGSVITLELDVEKDKVIMKVKDQGIGIAEDEFSRIFEMFGQLSSDPGRASTGLGIGLNLVKGLVEMHDGEIQVHSEGLGKGSEFTVVLPLYRANGGELS